MNDPKDIVVSFENIKDENSLNQTLTDKNINYEKESITEERRFQNILFHLKENLSKRFYKTTLKEIDVLIQNQYLEGYEYAWKIYILKIRALLKIIKKKIIKYLINHYEKVKIKHNINSIKKYFNQVQINLNDFLENKFVPNDINDSEKIDDLIHIYFEYIYLCSFFHNKIGNYMESISYLSFVIRLYKETQNVVKSERSFFYIEKCFIFLIKLLIGNEDYFSAIEYSNQVMDICLKHIIYNTNDIRDGVFMGDKKKLHNLINNKEDTETNKNKYQNEVENSFGHKKIKKIIIHIVLIFFYRGICYENLAKIKNSIKCYYQCLWFIHHFFYDSYKNLSYLIQNILDRSLEFKEIIDYVLKKINYYKRMQIQMMNNTRSKNDSDKEEKSDKDIYINSIYVKKFKGLIKTLSKLKIKEIDTENKFDVKKNIRGLDGKKRGGSYKNIFLSDIRLLDTYLREDFKYILDEMNKIQSYDMDYQTKEKIQKFLRRIYFEQSQNKIKKINKDNKSNTIHLSSISKISANKNKIFLNRKESAESCIINNSKKNVLKPYLFSSKKDSAASTSIQFNKSPNKRYILQNLSNSCKNDRSNSAFYREKIISFEVPKNKKFEKISSLNSINLSKNNNSRKFKKDLLKNKSKNSRLNSAKSINRLEERDKDLNKFFNKKYIQKRKFIQKLEDREYKFQKLVLRMKDTPKMPILMFNKELIKQSVNHSFQKIMSLFLSNPINWKENLSQEEIKNIKKYDKLEHAMISSLNKAALIRFQNEEKKQKEKEKSHNQNYKLNDSSDLGNVNNNNKNMINSINNKIEELNARENIEINNYQKMLINNRKHLKYRNQRKQNIHSNCTGCKYRSENVTPNSKMIKLSSQDSILFNVSKINKKSSFK